MRTLAPRLRLLGLAVLLAATSACSTKRTLTIASDPPGARVWLEGKERGVTPLTVPFTYYGDIDVRLEKPGYRSVARVVEIPTQIDGYPLVDLPLELTVRRRAFQWSTKLEELDPQPSDEQVAAIRRRAEAFREKTRRKATREAVLGDEAAKRKRRHVPPAGPPAIVRPTGTLR
ncbi:MAG: PEGA domain-containing protein [Planctomycetota bacterium]